MTSKKSAAGKPQLQSSTFTPENEPWVPAQIAQQQPPLSNEPHKKPFPVAGIGASAGGLQAFEDFFSAMPVDAEIGMAFVLVQHLSPDHKSILADLISRYTRMQVIEVQDGMKVQPNCTYIIPPNCDMAFVDGSLQLFAPAESHGLRLPIDFFFRSLASDLHERAICIILSGTGSDGTLGMRAIKGEGGMAMAQSPESAEHNGMPQSAIATGLVDYVLPPDKMPQQLSAYATHIFAKKTRLDAGPPAKIKETLKKICVLLRSQTGHDVSQYKENTVIRRIERRMALHQIERPEDYLGYLRQVPSETEALYRDLLIGVTNFFRDPEAFAALQTQGIPRLFAGKQNGGILAWNRGAARMYGWNEMEALGMSILETVPQNKRDEYAAFMKRIKAGEIIETFPTQRRTKDGRTLEVQLTLTRIMNDMGQFSSIATTERNISECLETKHAGKP